MYDKGKAEMQTMLLELLEAYLDDYDFKDFLSYYDLEPETVVLILVEQGLIPIEDLYHRFAIEETDDET